MKYLKYLLFFIVILVLIFFGNGLLNPSITYENEVVVNKSVAESWAVMEDESRISEWLHVIDRLELVSGEASTVGAVSNIYVIENGEEMVMQETITASIPQAYMAMTFTMDFMNMDYELFMTEKDGKTHIRSKTTTLGNGIFSQSMISFLNGMMCDQEAENLNNLKKVIEQNQKNYFLNKSLAI